MPNIGFKDRETAVILKQVAHERMSRPNVKTRVEFEPYPAFGGDDWTWHELTANLDAGGTATANPAAWDPAAAGGDGDYAVDTASTVTVKDLAGQHWGLEGEWVRVQTRSANNGPVLEVISAGAPWHLATLDADLAAGGTAAATVTIGGASVSVDVTDLWLGTGESLAAGSAVGITYDVDNARWVDTEAVCGGGA